MYLLNLQRKVRPSSVRWITSSAFNTILVPSTLTGHWLVGQQCAGVCDVSHPEIKIPSGSRNSQLWGRRGDMLGTYHSVTHFKLPFGGGKMDPPNLHPSNSPQKLGPARAFLHISSAALALGKLLLLEHDPLFHAGRGLGIPQSTTYKMSSCDNSQTKVAKALGSS